ncbi:MAG: AI-2E family transporter [Firmicutes bacterium]|nr:AI-2E family transporter [Bacillota bacterium]
MKEKLENKYIAWGLTIFSVFAALILLFFAIYRWEYIAGFFETLVVIMMPFIFGLAISYMMSPVLKFFEGKVFDPLLKKKFKKKERTKITRVLSICTATIIFWGLLITCISFLIPEILKSLETLVTNINTYLSNSKELLIKLFGGSESVRIFIDDNYGRFSGFMNDWLNEGVLANVMTALGNSIFGTLKFLYNLIIGYIISIYILFDKEKFKAQSKKLLYTIFNNEQVNIILENTRYTDKVFGGFFAGKLLDSLIIGILCFVFMLLFKMPYPLIIAVIVGITNIIPYFGPFIGAIPSALLVLLVDPSKCIWFLVFIFILQQFDGNILGPKILGSKTGLSSFWVLFSLLIFGGLFGMVGMILGVPLFSILYSFLNGVIKRRLKMKKLPQDSKDYEKLLYISEKTGKPVYEK